MIRNFAALISLASVFSGAFSLSTQSVEAKSSRDSSRRAGNYFVPPPPPYTPSIVPSALGMTSAQAVTANADDAVVAKPSRTSAPRGRNNFVPPPPPYTPSIVPSALGMTNAQAVTADTDRAVMEKPFNPYGKYIFTHSQGGLPQVVQPNPYVSYDPGVETKVLKHIDYFDSEISSTEKEIGKLLNL